MPTKEELLAMITNTLTTQAKTTTSGKALTASPEMSRHMENLIRNQAGNLTMIVLDLLDQIANPAE